MPPSRRHRQSAGLSVPQVRLTSVDESLEPGTQSGAEHSTESGTETGAGNAARDKAPLTGDPAVDAVLSRLDAVGETPVADHAALYADLHDGLLAALNEDPAEGTSPDTLRNALAGPGVA